jgi:hypothetical protein
MGTSDKPFINLKGFIASNGATDWNTDPYISTIEVAHAFSILPNEMYNTYVEEGCRLYWQELKVIDHEPCPQLFEFIKKRLTEVDIYNFRRALDIETNTTL